MDIDHLHVHVVDDDEDFVRILTKLFETAGHRVTFDTSSRDALASVERLQPDCVFVDLMMPGKDGLQVCKDIRDNPGTRDARIIVVSAKPYEFDRRRAFQFGANGYITKPIDVARFIPEVIRILEDKIDMMFWGVRGTLPVPGPRSLRYGGNTSCVTLEFNRRNLFIFDAGTGIKALSDHLLASRRLPVTAKVFISHPHWDHINALPFFVPLYLPGSEFEICGASHGDATIRETISAQMDGIYFPITIKEFGARVFFRNLKEETFRMDDVTVRTMLLNHPGYCLGYRVEYNGRIICYVTDNEIHHESSPFHSPNYLARLRQFVAGADALIADTTYTDEEYKAKVGWGHSCLSRVAELAHEAAVKSLYLFHHDPDQDDDAIDAKLAAAQEVLARLGSSTRCVAPAEGQTFRI